MTWRAPPSSRWDSNPQPPVYKTGALPIELREQQRAVGEPINIDTAPRRGKTTRLRRARAGRAGGCRFLTCGLWKWTVAVRVRFEWPRTSVGNAALAETRSAQVALVNAAGQIAAEPRRPRPLRWSVTGPMVPGPALEWLRRSRRCPKGMRSNNRRERTPQPASRKK